MTRATAIATLVLAVLAPGSAAAAPPAERTLSSGWEMRVEAAAPAPPQEAPPEETAPGSASASAPRTPPGRAAQTTGDWHPTTVPSVFDTRALPSLYPGTVRTYRVSFRGPATPRGFSWLLHFESVRRGATVFLNGRRLGRNADPYTPFTFPARGLRPGRSNTLDVIVDGRKNPKLPEAWWNWNGIVRPVSLVPAGPAHLEDLGTMSKVRCSGPARGCHAELLLDGLLERHGARRIRPSLEVRLRSPTGRTTTRRFRLPSQLSERRRLQLSVPVPAPVLWSPDAPRLYSATITLRERGRIVQRERRQLGLRSVQVKGGHLWLNNRRIQLRGASIHEDMPGSGAALTDADMDRIVADLKDLGANVTRAHYLLNQGLLDRFDRAGIMVWNQSPIWQRDAGAHLLWKPSERLRALRTVRRTVTAARSHPSVLTHSVANELTFTPDDKPGTKRFLLAAQAQARDIDPTVPISVDIKGRPGYAEQFTYHSFDMIGLNQYFGWYRWVDDFSLLEPYIRELRDLYPSKAIVMTEWGAEGRPELADAPPDLKGGYPFQTAHAQRTLDVIDGSSALSGAIYWTLREFEIYPGWQGGAGRRPAQYEPNTRHHKGLLTYEGEPKPAYRLLRDRFHATPLYP
ncbi:MAG TPA: glycoside hydrolase family 2 TIM barrel-domain containing protein [Thermoleophilaceae bacterium]|jgi:beta-glucuronidase|nr:glycoside hydrolase family 2 TIM barrel-domain containing protein [Thermoleophilaceae bacterium]